MGVNVVSIGCHPKLCPSRPKVLIEQIARLFKANIQIIYYNPDYSTSPYYKEIAHYDFDNSQENLMIEFPECSYLARATANPNNIQIDLDSSELLKSIMGSLSKGAYYTISGFKDKDIKWLYVHPELVEISVISSFRWGGFISHFHEELPDSYMDDLYEYRAQVGKLSKLLDCTQVVYFADQFIGEFILNRTSETCDDFCNYILSYTAVPLKAD